MKKITKSDFKIESKGGGEKMGYASKNAKKHNDRISDQEKVYHCAYCKGVVLKTDHYCQYCGKKLRKQSFFGCFAHYINEKLAKRFPNKRGGF